MIVGKLLVKAESKDKAVKLSHASIYLMLFLWSGEAENLNEN